MNESDKALLDSIHDSAIQKGSDKKPLTPTESMVCKPMNYIMELGSGEDFTQWFRWSEPSETKAMPSLLQSIGASNSSNICTDATQLLFPSGVPSDRQKYSDRLDDVELKWRFGRLRKKLSQLALQQLEIEEEVLAGLTEWLQEKEPQQSSGE